MILSLFPIAERPPNPSVPEHPQARRAAQKLEETFLSEMLKAAGLGAQDHAFGGGIGEEQFASFQRDALASALVRRGGIGLSEAFFQALTRQQVSDD